MKLKFFLILIILFLIVLTIFQFIQYNKIKQTQDLPQSPTVCAQVITSAKNPKTGECKDFPTPCDVPKDWIAQSCSSEEGKACGGFAGEKGEFACPTGYFCKYPKPMYPDAQGKCVKK